MKTLKDFLTEQIESMNTDELIALNNAYCEAAGYPDDEIFSNDEDFLNEYFSTHSEAVRAAFYGDYKYNHKYVRFDGYANLESLEDVNISDLVESVSTIVDYAIENQSDFNMLDFDFEEDEESLTDED